MTVICASKNHNSLVTIRDKLIAEKEGERKCQTDRVERLTNLELLATGSITQRISVRRVQVGRYALRVGIIKYLSSRYLWQEGKASIRNSKN